MTRDVVMTVGEAVPFGELLRRYRLAVALSQEALAERARLSASAVAALERGRRTAPRQDTVVLLAEALDLAPPDRAALLAAAGAARARSTDQPEPPVPAPASSLPPLPIALTSLIGREHEVATLAQLLLREGGARLFTLTGPGGVGKTRLALAVAEAVQDGFPDGVVFVDLAPLRDPALVAPAIAQALGLREVGAQGPREVLMAHLHPRHMLLVLDNAEQVVAAAPLVAELVATSTRLAVLTTSRVPLRVRAEQSFRVRPLDTTGNRLTSWEVVGRTAAVRLFAARAQAVRPDFALDAENTLTVAAICRRLDGLPLAIELAAARIPLLPPAALLSRLERRLPVLKAGARDLPPRQRTMRAAIEWSYTLLSDWEQALCRRLSVFAGGCTLEAAEAVTMPPGTAGDFLAGVETLVDHSLLQSVAQADGEPRFRMLETIREYGLEQLATSGEDAATQRQHAVYYLGLAEAARSHLFGPEQMRWLDLLEQEHDNLREILAGARERGDAEQGVRLAGALWQFWYIRCHLSEGRERLQEVVALAARAGVAPALRLDTLVGLAVISYTQTDYDQAAVAAEESVTVARDIDDRSNLAVPLNILGGVARYRSDFGRAAALGEECVALTRSIGDRWALALSLSNLAEVARLQAAYERATSLAEESLLLSRSLGDRWGVAQAFLTMGRIARDLGDDAGAIARLEEGLAIARELGHTRDIALAIAGLGNVALSCGDEATAAARFEESLALLRPIEDKLRLADVLTALGRVRHAQGDDLQAARFHREGLTLFQAAGNRLGVAESLEGVAAVVGTAATLDTSNKAELAAGLLAVAARLREAIGSPLAPADRSGYERTLAAVRAALGDARFNAAWATAQDLSLDQAVAEALEAV